MNRKKNKCKRCGEPTMGELCRRCFQTNHHIKQKSKKIKGNTYAEQYPELAEKIMEKLLRKDKR